MTTPSKNFAVFDGDSHIVEPRELWDQYLEPEYRVPGRLALWREEGRHGSYLKINGEMFRDTDNVNIPSYGVWRPGMSWESVGELDPNVRHPVNEGAFDPRARLRDMDAIGVDQALLYPTWFAEGFPLVKDPDMAFALEELHRIAKIPCFRGVFIRPAFIEDRYLNHPYYEPLWAELEASGVTAAVHSTPGLWNPEWTSHGPFIEKIKSRLSQSGGFFGAGGGPGAGGGSTLFQVHLIPLGHPMAPILAQWLDNYMFVGSTLLGFSVMQRYP